LKSLAFNRIIKKLTLKNLPLIQVRMQWNDQLLHGKAPLEVCSLGSKQVVPFSEEYLSQHQFSVVVKEKAIKSTNKMKPNQRNCD